MKCSDLVQPHQSQVQIHPDMNEKFFEHIMN